MKEKCTCRTIFGFQGRAEGVSNAGCRVHGLTLAEMEAIAPTQRDPSKSGKSCNAEGRNGPSGAPSVPAPGARRLLSGSCPRLWCRTGSLRC